MGRQGKTRFVEWAEYLAALPLLLLFRFSPYWLSIGVSRALGLFVYLVSRTGRKVAKINLGIAFGNRLSKHETRIITRKAYISFAQTIAEFVCFLIRPDDAVARRTEVDGLETFENAVRSGRGIILCSAHFSNWYWPTLLAAGFRIPQSVVVRPLDNSKLNRLMIRMMKRRGIDPLPRRRSVRPGIAALRRGEVLGLMVDQNSAVGGRFVSFFGTPASTMRGVAVFRRLTDAVVLCVHHLRERESGRHRIVVSGPVSLPDDEALALQRINQHFENVIRQRPDAYSWMHPRWKTRPGGETTLYPGLRV